MRRLRCCARLGPSTVRVRIRSRSTSIKSSTCNARSSLVSSANWRRPSVCSRVTARARRQNSRPQPERRLRQRRQPLQRDDTGARPRRLQKPLAANAVRRTSATRSLRWQPARRSRRSPPHARALAPTMSAPRFPGTSGRAASKSAMGNSTPNSQRGRSNRPRSDTGIKECRSGRKVSVWCADGLAESVGGDASRQPG
jgi:hypothetical protein